MTDNNTFRMWCLTLRNERQREIFYNYVQRTSVVTALVGPRELYDSGEEHWHAFLEFNAPRQGRQWRGVFDGELNNMWIRPLRAIGEEGIRTARRNYIRYCTKEGAPDYCKGINIHELSAPEPTEDEIAIRQSLEEEQDEPTYAPPQKKNKTSELIRDAIIRGEKPLDLYKEYPGCVAMIRNLLPLHQNTWEQTVCAYIYGGTGVGKTTNLKRVLNYFEHEYEITHYYKIAGLSKFFNGYNFDDVVVIDDPIEPDSTQRDEVQMFKSIINEHQRQIEIKGSSMPWDTKLDHLGCS